MTSIVRASQDEIKSFTGNDTAVCVEGVGMYNFGFVLYNPQVRRGIAGNIGEPRAMRAIEYAPELKENPISSFRELSDAVNEFNLSTYRESGVEGNNNLWGFGLPMGSHMLDGHISEEVYQQTLLREQEAARKTETFLRAYFDMILQPPSEQHYTFLSNNIISGLELYRGIFHPARMTLSIDLGETALGKVIRRWGEERPSSES